MARKRKRNEATTTTTTSTPKISYNYSKQETNGSVGLSDKAQKALNTGTYGQITNRQAQSYRSEDQSKIANPTPVPALKGMNTPENSKWESNLSSNKSSVDTDRARRNYAERTNYKPLPSLQKKKETDNYVIHRDRYDKLMQDGRLANDIKKLAEINYKNANQDATVSQEWADEYGAKKITGGFNKDQYIKTLSRRYGLTSKELNDMALTFHSDAYKKETENYGKQLQEIGEAHPVLGSVGSLVGTLGSGVEGVYNAAVGGISGDDRYLSNIFSTTKKKPREGAKENIKSDLGKGAYDISMGVADMGVGAAAGSAPAILAGNTANDAMESAMERGSSVRKSAAYGAAAGALDFITNKIGLDKAKNLAVNSLKSTGIKKFLAQNAIAGLGEAGENILQDIGQSFIDGFVNGENAELNQSYNNKVASGMDETEAFKAVAKEYLGQLVKSGVLGFGMGSAMQAGASALPKVPGLIANKLSNNSVGAVDPSMQNIINMGVPEVRPEITRTDVNNAVENPQNLQSPAEKISTNPAEMPQNQGLENLQTAPEKIEGVEDVIGDILPETNARQYSDAEIEEIADYAARRDAIRTEMNKSVNMFDPNAMQALNEMRAEGKALDAEMQEKYPELFNTNGKFTGVPEITEPIVNTETVDNQPQTGYNDTMTEEGSVNNGLKTPKFSTKYTDTELTNSDGSKVNFVPGEFKEPYKNKEISSKDILSKASPEMQSLINNLNNGGEIDYDAIENLPEIKYGREHVKAGSSNIDYVDENGNYTPERQVKQREIVDKITNRGSAKKTTVNGKTKYVFEGDVISDANRPEGERPVAVFATGISSSGKSSVLANPLSELFSARILDNDDCKEPLPEFNNGLGASYVHEESGDILDMVKDISLGQRRENVVVPIVGGNSTKEGLPNPQKTIDKMAEYAAMGYDVYLCQNDLPSPKAMARMLTRYLTEGRFLPPELIAGYKNFPQENFLQIINGGELHGNIDGQDIPFKLKGYAELDNDVPEGQKPRVLKSTGILRSVFGNGTENGRTGIAESGAESGAVLGEERQTRLDNQNNVNLEGQPQNEVALSNGSKIPQTDVNFPAVDGVIAPHTKTSEAYTNTGRRGGGWTESEYDEYTDPSQFQYEDHSEVESMDNARSMRETEGREGFKNRVMGQERLSGAEIDGLMMEWRDLTREARELEKSGESAKSIWDEAVKVFRKVQSQESNNAQAMQALAKWSRNTPEGMLVEAENILNGKQKIEKTKLREKFDKMIGNRKKFHFSDEFVKEFMDEAEGIKELDPESRAAKERMAKLGEMVNSQLKSTFGEKLTTFLMDNMLGNFRTLITRNAGGNVGLNAVEQLLQRPLAAGIDTLASLKTGKRTQAGLSAEGLAEYITGFAKGIADEARDFKQNIHTSRTGENTLANAIRNNRHVFKKGGIMDFRDRLVKHGLSVGDRPFYEAVYKQTLGDYERLRKSGKMGEDVQNLSDKEFKEYADMAASLNALSAVYQNDTKLSSALLGFKESIGDLSKGVLGVDILSQFSMPFVKTPANVVDVGISYSPLGLIRNMFRTGSEIKNGAFDQNRFANETARNVLGTGLMTGAAMAASKGILGGSYSDDADEKQAQKEAGMQEYGLNYGGNKQMDIGWLPVVGSNAVAAAAAQDAFEKGKGNVLANLATGAARGGKAMFDQSMFQGLQRLFGTGESYNSDEGIVGNMMNVVKSGLGQAVPSLERQIGQVIDPYQRDVANSNEDMSLGMLDNYNINSIINTVPFLREQMLAPKVNTSGELMKENQGRSIGHKIVENMLLPGRITEIQTSKLADEAKRISDLTGNKDSYLPKTKRDAVDTEGHTLSNKEWTDYEQRYYKELTMGGEKILESENYKNASPEVQESTLKYLYQNLKTAINSEYNDKELTGAAKEYKEAGGGEKGVQAVVDYYNDKIIADELGMKVETYRKKEAEVPGSAVQWAQSKQEAQNAGFVKKDGNVNVDGYNNAVNIVGDDPEKIEFVKQYNAQDFKNGTNEKVPYVMNSNLTNEQRAKLITNTTDPTKLKGAGITGAYDVGGWDGVWYWRYAQYLADTQFGDGNGSVKKAEKDAMLDALYDPNNPYMNVPDNIYDYFVDVPNKQW